MCWSTQRPRYRVIAKRHPQDWPTASHPPMLAQLWMGASRASQTLLPTIGCWFYVRYGRDFGPNVAALLVWVANQLPPHQTAAVKERINVLQPNKGVNVVPFEWAFRYLLQLPEGEGA